MVNVQGNFHTFRDRIARRLTGQAHGLWGVHLLREGFQPAFKRRLDQGVCCSIKHKEPGCPAIALESAQLILHTLVTDGARDLPVEEDHSSVDVIVGNAVAQQPWCVPLGPQSIFGHVADFQVGPVGLECMKDHLLVRSSGKRQWHFPVHRALTFQCTPHR